MGDCACYFVPPIMFSNKKNLKDFQGFDQGWAIELRLKQKPFPTKFILILNAWNWQSCSTPIPELKFV